MPGRRKRNVRDPNPERMGPLVERLQLMFEWYTGMIDESTGRLLYLYDPERDITVGDGEPIRDIAAVWDVEVLSAFLRTRQSRAADRRDGSCGERIHQKRRQRDYRAMVVVRVHNLHTSSAFEL